MTLAEAKKLILENVKSASKQKEALRLYQTCESYTYQDFISSFIEAHNGSETEKEWAKEWLERISPRMREAGMNRSSGSLYTAIEDYDNVITPIIEDCEYLGEEACEELDRYAERVYNSSYLKNITF